MSNQKNDIPCLEEQLQQRMKVWHFDSDLMPARISHPQWPQDYSLVAALDTDCLDEAFYWTNEDDGWRRDEVLVFEPFGWDVIDESDPIPTVVFKEPRSTSVGDVFVTGTGAVFLVENCGFRQIGHTT